MHYVIDIETNNPGKLDDLSKITDIWVIVCKNIETNEYHIFRNVTGDKNESERFSSFCTAALERGDIFIGHNCLGFDCPVLVSTLKLHSEVLYPLCLDTLILSRLINFSRKGHSIEDYGSEFGFEKIKFNDFSKWSQALETYCIRDVDICHRIYNLYARYITNPDHARAIALEHRFQLVVNDLHNNGFGFNRQKAERLLEKVTTELEELDKVILEEFPPRLKLIREVTPKATKFGTISLSSIPKALRDNIAEMNLDAPFSYCKWEEFNPSSHKQIVQVLNEAGWQPSDKTQVHIDTEREIQRLKYSHSPTKLEELNTLDLKLENLRMTGWKVNETNLTTLPSAAPSAARSLAKRILLESRRRTLVEWLNLLSEDGRIHGRFQGIGAWTHRMSHQNPNTANIANEFDTEGKTKLLGKEFRQLWIAPRNRLLVGVDAEGIQLRIFAHYINDPEFTDALVRGKKEDKTDPHSLNARILGSVCKSRQAAKRFIYALLLGAGNWKLSQILGCSEQETKEALDRLLSRYTGWKLLKEENIPKDGKRGYFIGLDGRKVAIPGSTTGERKHLAMSGYLQNGEAVVMKMATLKWLEWVKNDEDIRSLVSQRTSFFHEGCTCPISSGAIKLVNFVHDEWQTETPNDLEIAVRVAKWQCESLVQVGEELNLNCPLAGSYWNDDHHTYTIGTNWYQTH